MLMSELVEIRMLLNKRRHASNQLLTVQQTGNPSMPEMGEDSWLPGGRSSKIELFDLICW